jgi:hypothetical protein
MIRLLSFIVHKQNTYTEKNLLPVPDLQFREVG